MKVRDGMSHLVLTIGPAHTLRQAARMMSARRIGAAVVIDPEHAGIGILTERDILDSVAAGEDPDAELAAQHRTEDLTFASPDWTLEEAAAAMVKGGFRHLVVIDGHDVAGLLSMRNIVRCWTPAESAEGTTRSPSRRQREPQRRETETAGSRVWVTNGQRPTCGCWPRRNCGRSCAHLPTRRARSSSAAGTADSAR